MGCRACFSVCFLQPCWHSFGRVSEETLATFLVWLLRPSLAWWFPCPGAVFWAAVFACRRVFATVRAMSFLAFLEKLQRIRYRVFFGASLWLLRPSLPWCFPACFFAAVLERSLQAFHWLAFPCQGAMFWAVVSAFSVFFAAVLAMSFQALVERFQRRRQRLFQRFFCGFCQYCF